MIYRTPSYTKKFKCAASDCRDSCCIGWEIAVDDDTLQDYRRMTGTLGADIRKSLSDEGCFLLGENGRCPHLLKNGLCRIICEAGEEALCDICREHPRYYNYVGDVCEWGVGLSCESAARLILAESEPLFYAQEESDEEAEECDSALFSLLFAERESMLSFAMDKKYDLSSKLFILDTWAKELQFFIDNADVCKDRFAFSKDIKDKEAFFSLERFKKYKELILSLEPLADDWPMRVKRVSFPQTTNESGALCSRLLAYFIFRYFLSSALEGDCTAGMGLALFAVLWIYALCESEGRCDLDAIAEAAKDFSKEVEYSEENRDAILEFFSAFAE